MTLTYLFLPLIIFIMLLYLTAIHSKIKTLYCFFSGLHTSKYLRTGCGSVSRYDTTHRIVCNRPYAVVSFSYDRRGVVAIYVVAL